MIHLLRRFWTRTTERDRGVSSGFDLLLDKYAELDSRSALDRYFVEVGTRRDSTVASAGTQVGGSPWDLQGSESYPRWSTSFI